MSQPPPTTFRVRSAVAADDAALVAIDATAWSTDSGFPSVIAAASQPGVTFFTADNPPGILLVAESCGGGEVIGYIRVKPPTRLPENAHVLQVAGIAVLASARGQGVATELLAAAERYAIEQGARKLSLRVLATNASAIRLYKRLGFVPEAKLVDEFLIDGRYVDDLSMAKRLDVGRLEAGRLEPGETP